MEINCFFQFAITTNFLVSSFCFIWISMVWVHGHYSLVNYFRTGTDFRGQNRTSKDGPRTERVHSQQIIYTYFHIQSSYSFESHILNCENIDVKLYWQVEQLLPQDTTDLDDSRVHHDDATQSSLSVDSDDDILVQSSTFPTSSFTHVSGRCIMFCSSKPPNKPLHTVCVK